jgi:ABC-type dipeptide/oligopeptide/nickel transport system permease component
MNKKRIALIFVTLMVGVSLGTIIAGSVVVEEIRRRLEGKTY